MFEISEPFNVRIPNPIRHNAGEMEVESIGFDGLVVRVTYAKAKRSLGWWCRRETHEFDLLQDVHTNDDAICHFVDWLAHHHKLRLSDAQCKELARRTKVVPAGSGEVAYLSAELAGINIAGAKNWIYVLSVGGIRGALRIPDTIYQRYLVDRFEVVG